MEAPNPLEWTGVNAKVGTEPGRIPEVPATIERLGQALDYNIDRLNLLASRLTPVVRMETPSPTAPEQLRDALSQTALSSNIEARIEQAQLAARIVDSLLERLEL